MPITATHPTADITAAANQARSAGGPTRGQLQAAGRADTNLGEAVPVYVLSYAGVVAKELSQARLVSWRFPLTESGGVAAALDVAADGSRAIGLDLDGAVAAMARSITRARDSYAQHTEDFELRLLRVNAFRVRAVWLTRTGEDLVLPIAATAGGLIVDHPYPGSEFLDALAALDPPFGTTTTNPPPPR